MGIFQDPLRYLVAQLIHSQLAEWKIGPFELTVEDIESALVEPPQVALGDLAFGCFVLAKLWKQNPAQLASRLATEITTVLAQISSGKNLWIESVSAAGPYLNCKISSVGFGEGLLQGIQDKSFFHRQKKINHPRTMIEFSQPNTHKELHVGHMRNASLGDSLVKLKRYVGVPVVASTIPGDVGTHVAKCLWYLKYRNQEAVPTVRKGEWLGQMYSRANLLLEDEAKTEKFETNKAQLTEILQQLEKRTGPFFTLWQDTRQWSIDLLNQVYAWAEIEFDQWYWESEIDSPSIEYIKQLLAEGKLVRSEGAVGMDLAADNLGFCLLLKSDGTGLYATRDIELARRKFQDHHIDKSVYVVDIRQALHFKQVFRVLEKIGFSQAVHCEHLAYNFVELPDGAMSSRKGNIVPLMKLVDSMQSMIHSRYLSRYEAEWTQAERDKVAWQVAQGAIKFGMVKIDLNKKIVFDLEEWLKLDGDSGPFVQYSAARVQSLCRKFKYDPKKTLNWSLLGHPSERNVLQALLSFHSVIEMAAMQSRPSVLCTYLIDLSRRFNLFYHDCSIGQAENEDLKTVRLALSFCTGEILKHGLALLGIPAPERM